MLRMKILETIQLNLELFCVHPVRFTFTLYGIQEIILLMYILKRRVLKFTSGGWTNDNGIRQVAKYELNTEEPCELGIVRFQYVDL